MNPAPRAASPDRDRVTARSRAMGVVAYGRPIQPIELPVAPPKDDEVAVSVTYCGVCGTDVKIAEGGLGFSADLPLPHVPGHEVVGVVTEAGNDSPVAVGSRVLVYDFLGCGVCAPCRDGHENVCTDLRRRVGFTSQGGFAERLVLPHQLVAVLPDTVSDRSASALGCAMATAYRAVVRQADARAGDRVLVSGAGGVGLHAAQIAVACGAEVVAADVSQAALAAVELFGVRTIDAGDLPELTPAAFDTVIETSGHLTDLGVLSRLLRPRGRIVLVGYDPSRPMTLPTLEIVNNEIEIVGSRYATRSDLLGGLDLVARGLVTPVISRVLDLDDAAAALAAVKAGRVTGRISLRIHPEQQSQQPQHP